MQVQKFASCTLNKCYSIAPLTLNGAVCILVAAEKSDPCLLFDTEGKQEDVIWEAPGGTMSMVQVPDKNGWFLATHRFYSPDNSAEASIVLVRPAEEGWKITTVKDLPFCHRFSVISRGCVHYLVACTLKSGCEYDDDWRFPGKIYVAELPDDLENYNKDRQIEMEVLKDGLLKNHGFCVVNTPEGDCCLAGTENGIYRCVPPENKNGDWQCECILDEPASDMVSCDLDGDGKDELVVIAPFHGDQLSVWHLDENGKYYRFWDCPFETPMAHAIWAYSIYGKNTAVIGYRKGRRDLLALTCEDGEMKVHVLDEDCGPANVFLFEEEGKVKMVSANRETDEIGFYEFTA
ncbi:MAG: hypothetical protein IKG08_07925 [Eubacterium sp.]|nr:hypothetical protein [Eubacterium sp.]